MDREKVIKGLEACSAGFVCGANCPYEWILRNSSPGNCIAELSRDALKLLKAQEPVKWIKISTAGIYECSGCGQNVMTSDIDAYKYCHGCGRVVERNG